jgi:hypothetical protein
MDLLFWCNSAETPTLLLVIPCYACWVVCQFVYPGMIHEKRLTSAHKLENFNNTMSASVLAYASHELGLTPAAFNQLTIVERLAIVQAAKASDVKAPSLSPPPGSSPMDIHADNQKVSTIPPDQAYDILCNTGLFPHPASISIPQRSTPICMYVLMCMCVWVCMFYEQCLIIWSA